MHTSDARTNERGIALVIAMLVLLVITMLGIVMMASVAVNRQVAGQSQMMRKALNTADAGIGEAISHLRNGDANMVQTNPRSTAQIFLDAAGSVPVVGVDTTAIPTGQPTGAWLPYSSQGKGPDVLTITYKTDAARTAIYRYDPTHTPAVTLGGSAGLPIYTITSTGTAGKAKRTIVTDVVATPFIVNAKGALCAGYDIDFVGNAVVCGYNHSANTPYPDGENRRGNAPDCAPDEVAGPLPAAWSTGPITGGGASGTTSSIANQQNQTGFYNGPWEMLGMTQADFISFIGPPVQNPATLDGITYIDNDAVVGNVSTAAAFHSASGEGLLYVDGDLTLNAGFVYKGLVYVEGNLRLNGQAWILGGVVVKGHTQVIRMNGGATILYSSDTINQKLAQYGGRFTTLSWREK